MQSTNGMPDDSISTEVSAILNMYVYAQAETMDEQENKELSWAINDAAEKIAALLHQYAQRQVVAELKLTLHDTGGESDARWTFENVKRRLAQLTQEQPHE